MAIATRTNSFGTQVDPVSSDGGSTTTTTSGGSTGGTSSGAGGGSFSSAAAGTWDIPVVTVAAGVAKNAPALELQAGEVVEISPLATNTQKVYISTVGADAAKSNPRRALLSTSNPITISLRNLCELWVYADVLGEGVTVTVRKR